jgi:nitrous oxide reductase accessory protein NosL
LLRRQFLLMAGGIAAVGAASLIFINRSWGGTARKSAIGERCSNCGMVIKDPILASYLVVDSGELYYDEPGCMIIHYLAFMGRLDDVEGVWSNAVIENAHVHDYHSGESLEASKAWFVVGSDVKTPMGYGIIAFRDLDTALAHVREHGGSVTGWDGVLAAMLERLKGRDIQRPSHEQRSYSEFLDIHLEDVYGAYFTLGELLHHGRPVLLVFFATWCPTCSRNISALARAYPNLGGRVNIVLASFDPSETGDEIVDFMRRVGAPEDWRVAKPSIELLLALHVVSQETAFLITPEGEIAYERRFGVLTEKEWVDIIMWSPAPYSSQR